MKSVFSYENYRQLLKDFYLSKKKERGTYSYAKFSEEAGLQSPNYLKLVIDGHRNLTQAGIFQFAKALRLSHEELVYFESMVLRDQADSSDIRKYYSQRMNELRKNKPTKGIKLRINEFVSKWYFPAVVVAMEGKAENTDLSEIAKLIGISQGQLEECVRIMKEKKILTVNEGKYSSLSNHIDFHDPKFSNIYQKNYLHEQLQKSMEAFKKRYNKDAKFQAHTFTIPESEFANYENQIHGFIETLIAKADQGPAEKLAQLNLQFFKLGE